MAPGEQVRDRAELLDWLLQGDPAIRWQVMLDLLGANPHEVAAERKRVATVGWGARLLALQDADGLWAQGLYNPKWTSTTYTLLLLHWLGLPAGNEQALAGCRRLWNGAGFHGGGLTFGRAAREPETCITGMLVLLASSFRLDDERVDPTVEWLLAEQLADGGWNCDTVRTGSSHGSFNTSITVLDALRAYAVCGGPIPVAASMRAGEEFFLNHSLYRSHRTGRVVKAAFSRFPFPPQWHFDVMRGLEHFRAVSASRDPRLADAVEVVRRARGADGAWPAHRGYPGREWFPLESSGPSRWATLRALRILDWWDTVPTDGAPA